ncbi:polysaccharide pyruvyl transferase family protein, partial [Paenibacillus endophyticus]
LAKNLSMMTGYKIIAISSTYRKSKNVRYIKTAGPEEFLGLFKNAEYIVTNSFHGTAFSINFNKQFFTELLPNSVGTNSRMEDILDLFDLRNRQILSSDSSVANFPIDYSKVNQILEIEREKSINLLKDIL